MAGRQPRVLAQFPLDPRFLWAFLLAWWNPSHGDFASKAAKGDVEEEVRSVRH